MSYHMAKQCFTEARNMVGEPTSDPQTYNLHQGLLNLTDELETDISTINRKLDLILAALQRR
jgi:hypothetical protein